MEIIIGLIIFIIIDIIFLKCINSYGKAKYGKEEWNRQCNVASQQMEYGKGYGIKCPNCGQINVKKISTTSRAISVSAVGLASDKIGKTYKCPKCGYMW